MSDFLTNLAARALGSPTLRPRTRSRFEPEPDASPWIEMPTAVESMERAAPREIATPNVPAAERVLHDSVAPSVPIALPPLRRESEPPTRIELRELWSAAAPPPLLKAEALPPHSIATATHTEHHHTTERVVERAVEQHHHDHTTTRVEKKDSTIVHIEETAIDRQEPTRDDDPQPPHRYDVQPPRVEREHHETPQTPRAPERQRPRVETAPAVPEPTIHVSIGRVEVRAAAPAATPQRARTRNAPMTIEDYAARRNAKGRP